MTSEPEFTFGAEHVHTDYWCGACIEEGHRRARLSHDRGADAEWDAMRAEVLDQFTAGGPPLTLAGRVLAIIDRHREAALSVPAPTLPALDALEDRIRAGTILPTTAAELDIWLVVKWPLLRDEYVAYVVAKAFDEMRLAEALRAAPGIKALAGRTGHFNDAWWNREALAILEALRDAV